MVSKILYNPTEEKVQQALADGYQLLMSRDIVDCTVVYLVKEVI